MTKIFWEKVFLWLPPFLWAAIIFHFSSGSAPVTSSVYWQDFAVKKTGHIILFGILAILVYRALIGEGWPRKKAAIWSVIFTFFYGATDEFHQLFTQGRESRLRDVFIDGVGASLAISIIYYFLPKFPEKIKLLSKKFGIV